ncbi:SRA stem-loop-interacting RNA-binding protein, mitochondrial [Diprion similis]|uniref:SRA stem-loop-interacting RNA-binding protein, mitochondrial n=1 Tax=Diprion similis TaxID=362088 RepID=UPI001EF9A6FB|nr:SRA stem-loop-interacting RNA-binding protein, mitochondrial [Diprion similis]
MAAKVAGVTNKLFVSNLPWTVAHKELKNYFSQFGFVSSSYVAFDLKTGMSRGFGFVTFSNKKETIAAMNMETHILEGNRIYVKQFQSAASHF